LAIRFDLVKITSNFIQKIIYEEFIYDKGKNTKSKIKFYNKKISNCFILGLTELIFSNNLLKLIVLQFNFRCSICGGDEKSIYFSVNQNETTTL